MANFKTFKVWDRGKLVNKEKEGSLMWYFAEATIACVKENVNAGYVSLDLVFSRNKSTRASMFRGFIMVSLSGTMKKLGMKTGSESIVTSIFGRSRSTIYNYKKKARYDVDPFYRELRYGPVGRNVAIHLEMFLHKAEVFHGLVPKTKELTE